MSRTFYLIYGTIISMVFAYASFTGWNVFDFSGVGRTGPTGPGHYHK
jgi:hypothetical protein